MEEEARRSGCPIATTLDLVGDKWTLVLVRDMVNGKRRYKEFLASPEGIPTNILAARLKKMVSANLAVKTPYVERPMRFEYALTEKGYAMLPVLQEMCRWGNRFFPETWTVPEEFMELQP